MGAMLTSIAVALSVLIVVLQFRSDVHVFSGLTLFKVVTLEAKRVHLEVDTPILLVPTVVGLVSCFTLSNSQRRRKMQ